MAVASLQQAAGAAVAREGSPQPLPAALPPRPDPRSLYFGLYREDGDPTTATAARRYLAARLREAAELPLDMPSEAARLADWMAHRSQEMGRRYRTYLEARAEGAPPALFPQGRAQALYALQAIAPTKLVDGAWLYGLVRRWHDPRYVPLLRTYLEELGEGRAARNHVLLYKKLLADHGLDGWPALPERWFVQGAIQLALAHNAEAFLPELIGYNLGYEQLPLHLLTTAHELDELGIDPYYFTLHVTIDNASSGHARAAVDALLDARPRLGNSQRYYQRVGNGYRLNQLGAGIEDAAGDFDLNAELHAMLARKSKFGRNMHRDTVKFDGRTVNEWLREPARMPDFLEALQRRGWIKRNEPPQRSRFWQLLEGEGAQMYGAFNVYERQLVHDWIAGSATGSGAAPRARVAAMPVQAYAEERGQREPQPDPEAIPAARPEAAAGPNDFDRESRLLHDELARLPSRAARLNRLVPLLSPAQHWSEAGLAATRMFSELLYA